MSPLTRTSPASSALAIATLTALPTRREAPRPVPPDVAIALPDCDIAIDLDAGIVLRHRADAPTEASRLALLVTRIQSRDEAALAVLHAASAHHLFGSALRIAGRIDIAHEAVSLSFMQVWQRASDFDTRRGSAMSWLHAIVRSRTLDLLRLRRTHARFECDLDEDVLATVADCDSGPCVSVEQSECRRRLGRAMSRLPPIQRQVLSLTFLEGFSQEDAAKQIGLPLGTLKSHARRGLAALRQNVGLRACRG